MLYPVGRFFLRHVLGLLMMIVWLATPVQAAELDDIAHAMGTDKVKTIEFTSGGTYYHPGGSALAHEEWPPFKIVNLRQRINFETKALGVEMPLEQKLNSPRGAGFQPIKGLLVRGWYLHGDTAWRMFKDRIRPSRSSARSQHWLWTSPHGLIKAAQEAGSKVNLVTVGGKKWHTVAIGKSGLFRAIGWFDVEEHLLRKVEAQFSHEVLNDMSVVTLYTGYKTFDGIKHPARIIMNYQGHPAFDLELNTVTPNAPVDIEVPDGLEPYALRTTAEKVADGIWYIRGGSHHSVAIEMEKDIIVFEAPISVARGNAVLKAVREAIPKKRIRFVINSHHHYDHSGGLRAFAYQEIPILTHETNQALYEEAYATARSINPDMLSNTGIKARFLTMGEEYKILDAERIIELYTLTGSPHAESNIVAYLPKEKMLIVADAFSSRKPLTGPLPKEDVNPTQAHLWKFIQDRDLDVETILPMHGNQVDVEQLEWAAGIGAEVTEPEDAPEAVEAAEPEEAADKKEPEAAEKPTEEKSPEKVEAEQAKPEGDAPEQTDTEQAKPDEDAPEKARPESDATEQTETEQAEPDGDASNEAKPQGDGVMETKPIGDALNPAEVLNSTPNDDEKPDVKLDDKNVDKSDEPTETESN